MASPSGAAQPAARVMIAQARLISSWGKNVYAKIPVSTTRGEPMFEAVRTLSREGINFTYTENPADLNAENLAYYDGLMIYANHEQIGEQQEAGVVREQFGAT